MTPEEFAETVVTIANQIRQGLVNDGWQEGNAMQLAHNATMAAIEAQLEVEDLPFDERN